MNLKKRINIALMVMSFWCICFMMNGQCFFINGILTNVKTKQRVLKATIYAKNEKRKTQVAPVVNGTYEVFLSCDIQTLRVEAEGFRPCELTLNLSKNTSPENVHWFVPLVLVPIDQQSSDQPYSQQEQHFFEMNDSTKKGFPKAIRFFKVLDAVSNNSISASVCLIYTKNTQKSCFEMTNTDPKEVVFQEKDIVALEVKSDGYQSYNGNLIVDKLDNQKKLYDIKLLKELTILSISVNEINVPIFCSLIQTNGKEIVLKKGEGNHFYADLIPEKYHLRISYNRREILSETLIVVAKGLNTVSINIKKPIDETLPKPMSNPAKIEEKMVVPLNNSVRQKRILQFNQSDFRLRTESVKILDSLIYYLKNNNQLMIRIVGFTDDVGVFKKNQVLSEFRATVTKNYLMEKGIDENRFFLFGFGSKNAVSSNDTEENKAKNRRVEIQLID